MSKNKKIIILGIIAIMLFILICPTKASAALQSNGGASAVKDINGWITGIRQMQATGGTLGLTDTINGTNLTSGNKNLDIHMEKNTEYGAMVILSASSYGNPNKITNGGTTTGNKTGVVMNINKEWTATGVANTAAASMKNASGRYKNQYTGPNYTEKIGDAIETIGGWHGSSATTWLSSRYNQAGLIRAGLLRSYSGSVFSYYGYSYDRSGNADQETYDYEEFRRDADYRKTWSSRAAVVVGSGL